MHQCLKLVHLFSWVPVGLYDIEWLTGRRALNWPWIIEWKGLEKPWIFRASGAGTLTVDYTRFVQAFFKSLRPGKKSLSWKPGISPVKWNVWIILSSVVVIMTVYVNVLLSQIRDTESGQDLSDVLTKVKFSCLAWLHDNSGLFYNVGHHTERSVANNNIHNYPVCVPACRYWLGESKNIG